MQHTAAHCNIPQTATYCNTMQARILLISRETQCTTLQYTAAHCNTLSSHSATHCNTLQHGYLHSTYSTPIDRDILQHSATLYNTLQHTAIHWNTLQHTATHCNTLQHGYLHSTYSTHIERDILGIQHHEPNIGTTPRFSQRLAILILKPYLYPSSECLVCVCVCVCV